MDPRDTRLNEGMFEFAVSITSVTNALPSTMPGRSIAGQLFRAGTSGPANYEEACAAESRADFVHKMQLVLKELREARFWLRLVERSNMVSTDLVESTLQEVTELCNIIGKSIVTAKRQTK